MAEPKAPKDRENILTQLLETRYFRSDPVIDLYGDWAVELAGAGLQMMANDERRSFPG